MIDTLSQGLIALSTWAWLEVHASSFAIVLATLLAVAVLAVVAAALLATLLRRWGAASLPFPVRAPAFALATPPRTVPRPVGGRGPRAPEAAFGRLA
ncbi:hypothetical protein [Microbacterium luticocti]|uniref:hypothetical protein n=1 Tax=Microbacterium luticocti TaxID=451764 RepID=UPI0003FEA607|nr:hypothetical protein [Microbacterium luticocti]